MKFTVVTIFPEMFDSVLAGGVLGRAIAAGLVEVDFVDPRDFTSDRHRTVDDAPYGGGPGMVMKVEPLVAAIEEASSRTEADSLRLLMSPAGAPLDQRVVRELAGQSHLVLVCGRYEGIDQRVIDLAIDREVSLGDFVLSGGEIAAAAVIDAVSRYVPGVLGEATSTDEESFSADLLEYPHYTRPAEFRGRSVPEVLASGDHGKIAAWRRNRALARTAERRPDLLAGAAHHGDIDALAARTYLALVHHPVVDRTGAVVTSSVTNLDIHDIARSCATYGLAGYFAVSPVASQREKIERIVGVWPEQGGRSGNPESTPDHRIEALRLIRTAADLAEVGRQIERAHKRPPHLVATSARPPDPDRAVEPPALVAAALAEPRQPLLLLFGTGWGLAPEVIASSDQVLTPILGRADFNHLSVRSAVAAVLDRLFGLRP